MKLTYMYFAKASELTKFIADKNIRKEDIQAINSLHYGYDLFYWRKG